ncbi:MAG TPA: GNAT family N-acetyltransferase [Chroococcales cyanobacterium]
MNDTLSIEIAPRSEWQEVLAITNASYAEYEATSNPAFWSNYQKSVAATLLSDETVTRFVIKDGTTTVAAVLYCPPYEKVMGKALVKNPFPEMRLLAVPPEHRNRGLAGRLIEFCEQRAVESGWKTITLHTTVLMQTAKQMYERRGYIRYTDIDFEPVPDFIVWGYRKELVTD